MLLNAVQIDSTKKDLDKWYFVIVTLDCTEENTWVRLGCMLDSRGCSLESLESTRD